MYDRSVHLPAATLEAHLSALADLGAAPSMIGDVADRATKGERLPALSASITFDDAYANLVQFALPVLERYGFRATVFAPAAYVGTDRLLWNDWVHYLIPERVDVSKLGIPQLVGLGAPTAHEMVYLLKGMAHTRRLEVIRRLTEQLAPDAQPEPGQSRICTPEELRLVRSKGWAVGSHSMTHAILTTMEPEDAAREITESREALTGTLGEPPAGFAYPDGGFSPELAAAVRQAGYAYAVTTSGDVCTGEENPYTMPRIYPAESGGRFVCQVTGWEQRLRRWFRR